MFFRSLFYTTLIYFNFILQHLIYLKLVFLLFFFHFLSIELSWSCAHDHKICKLTHIFFRSFFLIFFYFRLSTSNYLYFDVIQFSFERGHPNITTGSETLHLDPGGLKSSFSNLFFNYIYIYIIFFFQHFSCYRLSFKFVLFIFLYVELSCSYLIY